MSTESKSDPSGRLRPSTSDASPSSTTVMSPGATAPLVAQSTGPTTSSHTGQQDDHHKPNKSSYSYSVNKQQTEALYQHYLKEELKSQKTRGSIFSSLSQHSQQHTIMNREYQNHPTNHPIANQRIGSNDQHLQNPRIQNHNMTHIYNIPPTNIPTSHHYANPSPSNSGNVSRSVPKDESTISYRLHQQQQHPRLNQRTYSTGALHFNNQQSHPTKQRQSKDSSPRISTHNFRQDQLDRDSEETATIKEELENDLEGCKNSELEAISSLERNLPIELSFLIRQQAHCLAKTNYLERQLRELRETVNHQQQVEANRISSVSMSSRNIANRPLNNLATATMTHTKNGNFILSDDSGGEYSRATMSDDDELSSLLDQIVKTVRPDQRVMNDAMQINSDNQVHLQQQQQYQHQHRLSTACNTMISSQQPQQQPYTIINPNQLHHQQAVPIFVMSSPIAVAHPSSISSNILPGVHFQPEPRYNQYYEDFYAVNNTPPSTIAAPTASMMQRQNFNPNAYRSQQHFDNSISAIEQLVSQKEKRQIIAQMKSADNWLKMRTANSSSSLFNQQESSLKNAGNKQTAMTTSDETKGRGDVASMR